MPKQRKKSTERRQRAISRRRFLEDVVVIASGTGVGLAAMSGNGRSLSAVSASKAHEGFKVLTLDQGELLTTVLNRLVPSQGKMPGAGDLGVAQFVDDVL